MEKQKLRQRRPAELTTFVASLVAIAAAVGFNVSTEVILAGFAVIGLLPSIVSFYIDLYKPLLGKRID